jgi:hypothetical protein
MVSVFVFYGKASEVMTLYYSLDFHASPLAFRIVSLAAVMAAPSLGIGTPSAMPKTSISKCASISGAAAIRRAFSLHSGVKPWRISAISVPSFP